MKHVTHKGEQFVVCSDSKEVAEHYPDARVCRYWEAKAGDIVMADNGYYVPLISKDYYEENFYRYKGRAKRRLTPKRYNRYVFPKMLFNVYVDKNLERTSDKPFSYSTEKEDIYGTHRTIAEKTGKFITIHKMHFAWLMKNGVPPEIAIGIVHPKFAPKHRKARLFLYMQCPQTMYFLFTVLGYMSNLKDELSKQGINHASLATKMAEYINDDKANVTLKKWAFETATKALEEPERMNAAPSMGNSIEGQYNAMDAVKERLQAKAKQLGMAH